MEYGAIGVWLALVGGLWLAGLPLAGVLFARFPDRGAAFGLPVALAVVGVVVSLVGQVSIVAGIAAGLLALVAGLVLALRLDVELSPRALLGPVIVFALAFGLLVAVRGFDPAVHPGGGEKFLDFGLLKSVIRADRLPPEDVRFAGEPVRYYYGGHMIAGVLTRLSGLEGRFAYNLALSTYYAAVVTAAYGLAGAVADRHGATRIGAGAVAAFFVGLASNLYPAGQALLWALPAERSQALTDWLGVERTGLIESPADFGYWGASRVIDGTINEFPLFAWLNGDLHAHMMSTPFLLLAAALCAAYVWTPPEQVWRRRGLIFGALPALTGLLALVNTWSFPAPVGLAWLSLALAGSHPGTLLGERVASRLRSDGGWVRREVSRYGVALACAAGVLVLALCWSLPFWLGPGSTRSVEFLPDRSALGPLLLVHGGFLLVFVVYLLSRLRLDHWSAGKTVVAGFLVTGPVVLWLAVVGSVLDLAGVAVFGPLLLGAWLLLRWRDRPGAWPSDPTPTARTEPADSRRTDDRQSDHPVASNGAGNGAGDRIGDRPDTVGFEAVLLMGGMGLALLVEFVYVVEQAGGGRYNTVFKIYAQVWVLFAVAAGAMAGVLLTKTKPVSAWRRASLPHVKRALTSGRYLGTRLFFAGLLVSTAIYGGLVFSEHFTEDRGYKPEDPTLDSLAFVEGYHPDEAAAIEWLDDREGQPNIVSAPGSQDIYGWVNAPSSLTGVPTIAGWNHEVGYRGNEAYYERVRDVETIYNGTSEQRRRLLAEYDVEYVYVGPEERSRYQYGGFESMEGVEIAAQPGAVTIYAVDQSELEA